MSVADYNGANAVQQLEPDCINFEFHDKTAEWAIYAYSLSYLVLFPVVALGVLIALARRAELAPFRVLCLAVTAAYLVSLPYFLLYPVPERWAFPGVERHFTFGSMVLYADQLDPAVQCDQQLLPQPLRVAHCDHRLSLLVISLPPSQHRDRARTLRDSRHSDAGHQLARQHHRGYGCWNTERRDCLAVHRYVSAFTACVSPA